MIPTHPHTPVCIVRDCTNQPTIGGFCNYHAAQEVNIQERRGVRQQAHIIGEAKVDPAGFSAAHASAVQAATLDKAMKIKGTVFQDNGGRRNGDPRMSVKYPQYYKPIPEGMQDLDIYGVCNLFRVDDSSGALQHALKKILLPGVRTGGKSRIDDIKEARDTLTRWLELHK